MVQVRSWSGSAHSPSPFAVQVRSQSDGVPLGAWRAAWAEPSDDRAAPHDADEAGARIPDYKGGHPITPGGYGQLRGAELPTIRAAIPSWWSFVLESAPVRAGPRPFCKRCRTFKGKSRPPGGCSGLFCKRCGVLKGMPPLRKRYNTCKVWYRCETGGIAVKTDPVARAPRPPGRRESHWGTLAALGQVSPHWGRLLTCPNGPLPTPNAPLPAPMTRCLSQCGSSPLHDRTTALPAALQPSSPAAGCHRALHHHAAPYPLPSTGQVLGFVGSGLGRFPSCSCVLALRLLQHGAAQCEVERAESHQWTRAAVAFPTSARSRYKPECADRRSLWMSPPSHKALRASTTTAPPEYEESGPALIG